jgi:hypothetical protein
MTVNELIKLYGWVRMGLLCAVPVAGWGFTYWLCGEFWTAVLFGIAFMLPLLMELPSKTEIKHRLIQERKRYENIWFKML